MSVLFVIDPQKQEDDLEALLDALCELEAASFSDPWNRESFREIFSLKTVTMTTLMDGRHLVAYALFSVVSPDAELLNLAVLPSERKKGYASALLDESFAYLQRLKAEDVFLEVREHNEAARRLYENKGFCAVGRRKAYYRFPTEDAIVMMAHLEK